MRTFLKPILPPGLGRRAPFKTGGGPRRERRELPADIRTVYAVGDVHGHLERLRQLEEVILADAAARRGKAMVVLLGDYVDRGPDSSAVLDHLLDPSFALPRLCLCGNHEEMMLDFLDRPAPQHIWLANGGNETLLSYGLDIDYTFSVNMDRPELVGEILAETIPPAHRAFLRGMPVAAYNRRAIFVHAGLRPGTALEKQSEADLLWMRQPFLDRGPELGEIVVVHGHTITSRVEVRRRRIGIDTGAYQEGGLLTAARIADDGFGSFSV